MQNSQILTFFKFTLGLNLGGADKEKANLNKGDWPLYL
ncbi:hypothetical protein VIOR3934_00635 [Vibrio orientalis CIP 102891 = ATCC 33934]|uniref:Uncharacterized protein n=1 Tax=Vibrio orientalis CIP 102891 = ATCC 33934 TaxID=675816 RepID=F9SRY5_VIBOR|nr:hypothetical protein VIOR3934_00635 [Vibrio orientalis CIP 102891 = ATCC 33934]